MASQPTTHINGRNVEREIDPLTREEYYLCPCSRHIHTRAGRRVSRRLCLLHLQQWRKRLGTEAPPLREPAPESDESEPEAEDGAISPDVIRSVSLVQEQAGELQNNSDPVDKESPEIIDADEEESNSDNSLDGPQETFILGEGLQVISVNTIPTHPGTKDLAVIQEENSDIESSLQHIPDDLSDNATDEIDAEGHLEHAEDGLECETQEESLLVQEAQVEDVTNDDEINALIAEGEPEDDIIDLSPRENVDALPELESDNDQDEENNAATSMFFNMEIEDLRYLNDLEVDETLLNSLSLLQWKSALHITDRAFTSLLQIMAKFDGISLHIPSFERITPQMQTVAGYRASIYHCCPKNCKAYTGVDEPAHIDACSLCGESRYQTPTSSIRSTGHVSSNIPPLPSTERKPRKSFLHIPLAPRLLLQYANPERAALLQSYPKKCVEEMEAQGEDHDINDWWHGNIYKQLCSGGKVFQDYRDLAFLLCTDGCRPTKKGNHEVMPVILICLNLPPEERFKKENILAVQLIPGKAAPMPACAVSLFFI